MSHEELVRNGTQAHQPDLDWSQVRETILMLELAVAQIDMAMRESEGSVDVLTNSFTSMVGQVKMIEGATASLPKDDGTVQARDAILSACQNVTTMMQQTIVAFQFYDKLSQKLSHVTHSIDNLADLISDQRRLYIPYEWVGLQEKIKSKYTMEEERVMFDAIMQGMTVKEALAEFNRLCKERKPEEGDIELF